MNEKNLLEQIKHSAEEITPPASLTPEAIEKLLRKEHSQPESAEHIETAAKKRFSVYRLGGLAAVFVLAFIGAWAVKNRNITPQHHDAQSPNQITYNESSKFTGTYTAQESEEDAVSEHYKELPAAGSYEAVYNSLKDIVSSRYIDTIYDGELDYLVEESAADMDSGVQTGLTADKNSAVTGSLSYSTTNVQEFGVDEGDVVKTDGKFIYILKKNGSVLLVSADSGELKLEASIRLSLQETPKELYVDGDRLSVIATGYYTALDTSREGVYSSVSKNRTSVHTYDITDPAQPVLLGTVMQDGSFSQSRKNGEYIYLFTSYSPSIEDTYEASSLIPQTSRGDIEASDVYLPEHLNYSTYLVASSVNIHDPEEIVDQKAVVSVGSTFYASEKNVYIANENWNDGNYRTEFIKLHYENGTILGVAAGSVPGYLNDSFSLNEYDGYLRVVTTSYDEHYTEQNGLYVLDKDLLLVGTIENLAPDETIRSARFMGDVGYFVTFRQTDPLFSVDLADPQNPKVLGALKISGFSSYLHFYSENLLLGMGYEADEQTGIRTGLKLSMFDISDPSNVTELHRLVLNGITWCNSLEDYKSILIDPAKNLFGFTCDNRYLLFSYNPDKGFVKEFIYDFYNDLISESLFVDQTGKQDEPTIEEADDDISLIDYFNYSDEEINDETTRGLYINDTLYLVRPTAVTAFAMAENYKEIGRLSLK